MPKMIGNGLSRREREVIDSLHALGEATANEVLEAMKTPPSYSAVRSILRILEEKGHISHFEDGKRYVYRPVVSKKKAAREALGQVVDTFFAGSLSAVVKSFLDSKDAKIDDAELDALTTMIEKARAEQENRG